MNTNVSLFMLPSDGISKVDHIHGLLRQYGNLSLPSEVISLDKIHGSYLFFI